jgi:hypothetical protein
MLMALVLSTRQEWTSTNLAIVLFHLTEKEFPEGNKIHHDLQENLEIQDFMLKVHPKT